MIPKLEKKKRGKNVKQKTPLSYIVFNLVGLTLIQIQFKVPPLPVKH